MSSTKEAPVEEEVLADSVESSETKKATRQEGSFAITFLGMISSGSEESEGNDGSNMLEENEDNTADTVETWASIQVLRDERASSSDDSENSWWSNDTDDFDFKVVSAEDDSFEASMMRSNSVALSEKHVTELANSTLRISLYAVKSSMISESPEDVSATKSDTDTESKKITARVCIGVASMPMANFLTSRDHRLDNICLNITTTQMQGKHLVEGAQTKESESEEKKPAEKKTKKKSKSKKKVSNEKTKKKKKTDASNDDISSDTTLRDDFEKSAAVSAIRKSLASTSISLRLEMDPAAAAFVSDGSMCTISNVEVRGDCLRAIESKDSQLHFALKSLSRRGAESDESQKGSETMWTIGGGHIDPDSETSARWESSLVVFLGAQSIDAIVDMDEALVRWPYSVSLPSDGEEKLTLVEGTVDILDILEKDQLETDASSTSKETSTRVALHVSLGRAPIASSGDEKTWEQMFAHLVPPQKLDIELPPVDPSEFFERQIRETVDTVLSTVRKIRLNPQHSSSPLSAHDLRRHVMYLLNASGDYSVFHEKLKRAVVGLVREEIGQSSSNKNADGQIDAQDPAYLAKTFRKCTVRCNRIVQKMVFEAGGADSDAKEDSYGDAKETPDDLADCLMKPMRGQTVPVKRFLAQNLVFARDAELVNDSARASKILASRVERVSREYTSNASEVSAKTSMLKETLRDTVEFSFRTGRQADALASLRRLCAFSSDDTTCQAVEQFGCALMGAQRFDDAVIAFGRTATVRHRQGEPNTMRSLALMSLAWEKSQRASRTFKHSLWPRLSRGGGRVQAEALADAALMLIECRMPTLAERALDEAQRVARVGFSCVTRSLALKMNLSRAKLCIWKMAYSEAQDYLEEALETATESQRSDVLLVTADLHFLAKRHAEAARCYETCLRDEAFAFPIQAFFRLGRIRAEEGRHDIAKEVYLRGCARFPCLGMWIGAGMACFHLNQLDEAEGAFAEANLLDNDSAIPWLYLSVINARHDKRYQAAWNALEEAERRDLSFDDATTLGLVKTVGEIFFDAGEMDLAKATFSKLSEKDAESQFRLGEIAENQNYKRDALELYRRILSNAPPVSLKAKAERAISRLGASLV